MSATDEIKRKILEAFFSRLWIEDDEHNLLAHVELHDPIVLIQLAQTEWKSANAKSAGDDSDALDRTPSNLYLTVVCSNKGDVVGPVGLEPTTRGLKVRCSTD